jgi:hypothetical protein
MLPRDPISMCAGKQTYDSAPAAAKAMKKLAKRKNTKRHNGLEPYRCRVCSKWHLGTPPTTSIIALRKMRDRTARKSRRTDITF